MTQATIDQTVFVIHVYQDGEYVRTVREVFRSRGTAYRVLYSIQGRDALPGVTYKVHAVEVPAMTWKGGAA